jgi:hypothetical protein
VVLQSTVGRIFAGVLAALAVATGIGLLVLWPERESGLELGTLATKTQRAEVLRIETFRCSGIEGTCRRVAVRLERGAAADA